MKWIALSATTQPLSLGRLQGRVGVGALPDSAMQGIFIPQPTRGVARFDLESELCSPRIPHAREVK
jgi:hypothetical protein